MRTLSRFTALLCLIVCSAFAQHTTIVVANGPTSTGSAGTTNQFYQLFEANNTPVTQRVKFDLVAGSNITITPSDNSVDTTTFTVAASGSGGSGVTGPGSSTVGFIPKWSNTGGNILAAGVAAPTGALVGTTDIQTLTNKLIDASEITTGTLPIARGGTGGTTAGFSAGTGIAITGSFPSQTIAGALPLSVGTTLNANPTGCDDYARYKFGTFLPGDEFGGCTVPIQQGIVAGMVVPNNSPAQLVCTMCLYEVGPGGSSPVESTVTLFALASPQSSSNEGTWAENLTVFNFPTLVGSSGAGIAGNYVGTEIDFNSSATGAAPTNGAGAEAVSAALQGPTGFYSGFQAQILAPTGYARWKVGFNAFEGCCTDALAAGPITFTGASGSMPILMQGRNSGGTVLNTFLSADQNGALLAQAAVGGQVVLGDIGGGQFITSSQGATSINGLLIVKTLGSVPTSLGGGQVVYCSGCTINACATPGTGAWAFYSPATSAWKCPF